jgi:steroid 5-alpha reductase family enzyme
MTFINVYLAVGIIILALMALVWLLSLALRNSSIVDIFWGFGFVITVWASFLLAPSAPGPRSWLLAAIASVWGLRLTIHILRRNWGEEEDFRYRAWREEAGAAWWWRSFFKVFLLQGFLMWLIAAPLIAVQVSSPAAITWLDSAGLVVWLIGFAFETLGDAQLERFKANPANRGQLLTSGVWRYSRHPNYFGDAAQWWGFYLVAAAAGRWWTAFGPLLMTFLLLRVSGVAMLEKSMKQTKPGFEAYARTTSAFVPWFPRNHSAGNSPLEG